MAETIETRPFPPFLPKKATVMMMGTFPPEQSKRAMEFHYPNFQNDMWRVLASYSLMKRIILEMVRKKRWILRRSKPFV